MLKLTVWQIHCLFALYIVCLRGKLALYMVQTCRLIMYLKKCSFNEHTFMFSVTTETHQIVGVDHSFCSIGEFV